MATASVTFSIDDRDYAKRVADELLNLGFDVEVGPYSLEGHNTYRQLRHAFKLDNSACILIMSKQLYVKRKEAVETFAQAAQNEQGNLHILSVDQVWHNIDDNGLEPLRLISYQQEEREGTTIDQAVAAIYKAATKSNHKSQLNRERAIELFEASGGAVTIESSERTNNGLIDYALYRQQRILTATTEFWLIIFPGAVISQTIEYVKHLHPDIFQSDVTCNAVRSNPGAAFSEARREQFSQMYGLPLYRFENLIKNLEFRPDPSHLQTTNKELNVPQRWLTGGEEITSKEVMRRCLHQATILEGDQLIVLTGAGGTGKTHFARHLHDKLIRSGRDVFFLVVDHDDPDSYDSIASLYDLYKACCASEGITPKTKSTFNLKFICEDPILIVDGLEELISKTGRRFDRVSFFADCYEMGRKSANGRIVITSREGNLPDDLSQYSSVYELQLFTVKEADDYFSAAFPDHADAANAASKILRQVFVSRDALGSSVPAYFCDLIRAYTKNSLDSGEIIKIHDDIQHERFRDTDKVKSFLLKYIFDREDKKFGVTWPAEPTLKALATFAKRAISGPLKVEKAADIMRAAAGDVDDSNLLSAVRDFILFQYSKGGATVDWRYDCYRDLSIADYLSDFLLDPETLGLDDFADIEILSTHATPGSTVAKQIVNALKSYDSEDLNAPFQLRIGSLLKSNDMDENELSKQQTRCISNLTHIYLSAIEPVSPAENLNVLASIFGKPGQASRTILSGLHFLGWRNANYGNFQIDVSGTIIMKSRFFHVDLNKLLLADEATQFQSCSFNNVIDASTSKKSSVLKAKFDRNCHIDALLEDRIRSAGEKHFESASYAVSELTQFLNLFRAGANFVRKKRHKTLEGMFTSKRGIPTKFFIDTLCETGLIQPVKGRDVTTYEVSKSHRESVRKFVFDSTRDPIILKTLSLLEQC